MTPLGPLTPEQLSPALAFHPFRFYFFQYNSAFPVCSTVHVWIELLKNPVLWLVPFAKLHLCIAGLGATLSSGFLSCLEWSPKPHEASLHCPSSAPATAASLFPEHTSELSPQHLTLPLSRAPLLLLTSLRSSLNRHLLTNNFLGQPKFATCFSPSTLLGSSPTSFFSPYSFNFFYCIFCFIYCLAISPEHKFRQDKKCLVWFIPVTVNYRHWIGNEWTNEWLNEWTIYATKAGIGCFSFLLFYIPNPYYHFSSNPPTPNI